MHGSAEFWHGRESYNICMWIKIYNNKNNFPCSPHTHFWCLSTSFNKKETKCRLQRTARKAQDVVLLLPGLEIMSEKWEQNNHFHYNSGVGELSFRREWDSGKIATNFYSALVWAHQMLLLKQPVELRLRFLSHTCGAPLLGTRFFFRIILKFHTLDFIRFPVESESEWLSAKKRKMRNRANPLNEPYEFT